jgi:hypothetical protein
VLYSYGFAGHPVAVFGELAFWQVSPKLLVTVPVETHPQTSPIKVLCPTSKMFEKGSKRAGF